jgi:hypothetical protein
MTRKTLALAAMVAGLLGILFVGLNGPGSGSATHLGLGAHLSDPQVFLVDQLTCRGGTNTLTGGEDATTFPSIGPCAGENTSTSALTDNRQDTVIHKGNRLSLGVGWSDNAFGVTGDLGVADGTQVGTVLSAINIACDDTIDYFVDNTSTLPLEGGFADSGTVPEQFREQTTTYTGTSGFNGQSELFLNDILPNTTVFTKHVRYRADVNFVTLGTSFAVPLVNPVSLNAATVNATFGDARASLTLLGGDASAPSAQLVLCLESPQTSRAIISGSAAGISNPATPGLYAGWTSYISAAGIRDEQKLTAGYITNCKHIGGTVPDADNDCLSDAADNDDADQDQDNDGLIDGVDVTYLGTAPCDTGAPEADADCDGDGRTDFEEMMNTAASLTNPRAADTDGDGLTDSGLIFDCDGNGAPDFLATSTNAGGTSGRNRVMYNNAYCKPTGGTSTNTSGLGGRPVGNPGAASEDNCPGILNVSQTNSSTVDTEKNSNAGDGTNGRFGGTPGDTTHFDAKFTGDACDGDADNDGIPDPVEPSFFFDPSGGTGGAGTGFCNVNRDSAGNPEATDGDELAISTDAADRDTDGDGSIDGVECQLARNPDDGASKPGTTLNPEQTTYYRLQGITQPGGSALTQAQTEDGSTIGNVSEVRGAGANAGSGHDNDRDGCPDETELTDVDANRVAGDSDRLGIARAVLGVSVFAPPGSAQADLEERRSADLDFNGVLGDPDRLAAARIVLTAGLATVPDYNLSCNATTIGYAAN